MDATEQLIASLASDGHHDSDGAFTLDRERARDKMRLFQLPDPTWYVLQLVQAAVLKGATRLRFDIDADDMRLRFDGEPFTLVDFEQVYGSLLSSAERPELEARRELALGLNAAMALNPRWIRIESGVAKMETRPGHDDQLETLDIPIDGTQIHVKQRFRPGLVASFFQNLAGTLPEEKLLKERCRFADVAIDLEGQVLSEGLVPLSTVSTVTFQEEQVHCAFGLFPDDSQGGLSFIKNGVWLETHADIALLPGIIVHVEGRRLRKNVSQTDVVRDSRYDELVSVVHRLQWEALPHLVDRALHNSGEKIETRLDWWFRKIIARKDGIAALRALRADQKEVPGRDWLLSRPLWATFDGGSASLSDVWTELDTWGNVQTSRASGTIAIDDDRPLIILVDPESDDLLDSVVGRATIDLTADVLATSKREANIEAWRARPMAPLLSKGEALYAAIAPIKGRGFIGQVGLRHHARDALHLTFIKDGCALVERSIHCGVLGLDAVIAANFQANGPFDDVKNNELVGRVFNALLDALAPLFETVAKGDTSSDWIQKCLQSFVLLLAHQPARKLALIALGLDKELATELAALEGAKHWTLYSVLRPPAKGRALGMPREHELLRVPLISTWQGTMISAVDLKADVRQFRELLTVNEKHEGLRHPEKISDQIWEAANQKLQIRGEAPQGNALFRDRPIMRGTLVNQALSRVVTSLSLRCDVTTACAFLEGAERFMLSTPASNHIPSGLTIAERTAIDDDIVSGEVALIDEANHLDGEVKLRLNGCRLGAMPHLVPIPRLVAVAQHDGLTPTWNWTGAEENQATGEIRSAIAAALPKLLTQRLFDRASINKTSKLRAALLGLAQGHFFTAEHRVVYEQLRRDHPAAEAEAHYRALLALDVATSFQAVHSILVTALRQKERPQIKTILDSLLSGGRLDKDESWRFEDLLADPSSLAPSGSLAWLDVLFPDVDAPMNERVLAPIEPLAETELFDTSDGRSVTVAEVIEEFRAQGEVLMVKRRTRPTGSLSRTVVLAPNRLTRDALRAIFGAALRDGTEWLEAFRQQRLQERYPTVEQIALDEQDALVSVHLDSGPISAAVGLVADHPESSEGSHEVRLCVERRLVATETRRASLHLVMLATDDDLKMDQSWSRIRLDPNAELRGTLLAHDALEPLAEALIASWPSLKDDRLRSGRRHAIDLLVQAKSCGDDESPLDERSTAALQQLPIVRTVDNKWVSYERLERYAEQTGRPIDFVMDPDAQSELLDSERLVLALDQHERHQLAEVGGLSLRDGTLEWERERMLVAWRKGAAPLPSMDSFESLLKSSKGLPKGITGVVSLPSTAPHIDLDAFLPAVSMGVLGHLVEERTISHLFPCEGVLDCPEDLLDVESMHLKLSTWRKDQLEFAAFRLYEKLYHRFKADKLPGWPARLAARRHLAFAMLAIVRNNKISVKRWQLLFGHLRQLPLLEIEGDQAISLDVAHHERPSLLKELGIREKQLAALEQEVEKTSLDRPRQDHRNLSVPALTSPRKGKPPAPGETQKEEAQSKRKTSNQSTSRTLALAGPPSTPLPEPTREDQFIEALRRRLATIHDPKGPLLSDFDLDHLTILPLTDSPQLAVDYELGRLFINSEHSMVRRIVEGFQRDATWLDFLISSIYSAVNFARISVTDKQESEFHHLLTEIVLSEITTREGQ